MRVCVCQEYIKIQLSDETAEKLSCKLEKENPEADLLSDISNNSVPIRG